MGHLVLSVYTSHWTQHWCEFTYWLSTHLLNSLKGCALTIETERKRHSPGPPDVHSLEGRQHTSHYLALLFFIGLITTWHNLFTYLCSLSPLTSTFIWFTAVSQYPSHIAGIWWISVERMKNIKNAGKNEEEISKYVWAIYRRFSKKYITQNKSWIMTSFPWSLGEKVGVKVRKRSRF